MPLVRGAQRKVKVKRALGDGGYDAHANFNFLASSGIEAGLKVRGERILILTVVGPGRRGGGAGLLDGRSA